MANPENKQLPYESTQKDIRDAIESVATAIGGIAIPSADHVSYDNSGSGLSATDVQNALDEIVGDIPTVNDGTLTIQQNGVTKASFSANTASNVTADIEVPTADKKTATDEFTTADGGLLSKCQINLVPVQSGSGDPSPDNIRPISGHTEVDLLRDGKNLCDPTVVPIIGTVGGYYNSTTLPNGSVVARIKGGETYTVSIKNAQTIFTSTCKEYPTAGTAIVDAYSGSGGLSITSKTITTSADANYLVVNTGSYNYEEIQIEKGNQATAYEPYLGHLYQVQIGSTVYGGYVDLVSGVMTSIYTLYTVTTVYQDGSRAFHVDGAPLAKADNFTTVISDKFKTASSGSDTGVFTNWQGKVRFNTSVDYASASDFMTAYGGSIQVCYELATPTTIQLTPQQIETLAGQNNLSTPLSGQSIETNGVEYKELFTFADVKSYVDKKIPDAPTTDGTYTLTATVSGGVPTYSWT